MFHLHRQLGWSIDPKTAEMRYMKVPHKSSPENTSLAISDLPGRPISDVGARIRKDTSLYVQDASPIVGMKPSYNASQQSSDPKEVFSGDDLWGVFVQALAVAESIADSVNAASFKTFI
jgi:hypothetical protein